MGFLTNPKTGRRMTADELIARERKEWGDALKTFAKELCAGADKSGTRVLRNLDRDLDEILRDHRRRKGKR